MFFACFRHLSRERETTIVRAITTIQRKATKQYKKYMKKSKKIKRDNFWYYCTCEGKANKIYFTKYFECTNFIFADCKPFCQSLCFFSDISKLINFSACQNFSDAIPTISKKNGSIASQSFYIACMSKLIHKDNKISAFEIWSFI